MQLHDLNQQHPDAPSIEFPCANYPVKIIGDYSDDYVQCMLDVVCQHVPEFDRASADPQMSSNGRFCSLRVCFTAQSPEQLEQLHQALRQTGKVRMVL